MATYPFASLGTDPEGAAAAILWQFDPHQPILTLLDIEVSSVADFAVFLPNLDTRLNELAFEMGLVVPEPKREPYSQWLASLNPRPVFTPRIFATASLAQMLALLSIAAVEIPEAFERLPPEDRDLKAALFTTAGRVQLSRQAAEKAESHPYNALMRHQVGQPRSAVVEAYTLGVLAGLLDPNILE